MRDPPGGDHMIDPVSAAASVAPTSRLFLVPKTTATDASSPPPTTASVSGASSPPAATAPAATRVYVDRSASGVYVYQLVDATTGRIIVELPRAESGSLKVLDGYQPGAATRVSV